MLADTMLPEAFEHGGNIIGARDVHELLDRVHPVERRMTGMVG